MVFEFKLPDIGEGVVEGEIITWHRKVGELIEEDDPLVHDRVPGGPARAGLADPIDVHQIDRDAMMQAIQRVAATAQKSKT